MLRHVVNNLVHLSIDLMVEHIYGQTYDSDDNLVLILITEFKGQTLSLTNANFGMISAQKIRQACPWACHESLQTFALANPMKISTEQLDTLVESLTNFKQLKEVNFTDISSTDGLMFKKTKVEQIT